MYFVFFNQLKNVLTLNYFMRIPQHFLMLLSFSILFIKVNVSTAQNTGRISGTITDKQSQKNLENISVSVDGTTQATLSDSNGVYSITGLPLKTYNISFSYVGYKKQTVYNVVITAGNEKNINAELEPGVNTMDEVIIKSGRRTARAATLETPLSVQRLTSEEIKSSPGSNFDISKVIQTLPGVGGGESGGSFRNDIIIRGGAPSENVYYLDGIEVPVINHFQTQGSAGGPQGILNVSFIEDVKLSSSAFDARYDNALSSVFQFKQKTGNINKLQGNVRLSAAEFAVTLEGPLSKNKKTTFLFSARRSYLDFLFKLLDLSIRPTYYDFQTKITHQINKKTTLSFVGIGAIDDFRFGTIKKATPEKLYDLNSLPFISQWTYTAGVSLKRLLHGGYFNIALSRNSFDNKLNQYEDNALKLPGQQTLSVQSRETENKLRIDVNKNINNWKIEYGAVAQVAEYSNKTFTVIRKQLRDDSGNIIQPAVTVNFKSPLKNFLRYGAFLQLGKRFLDNRIGISTGLRTDMNTFTTGGNNGLKTLSPRIALSYVLADKWTINGSVGRYYKIAPYTILGFADNTNNLVNKNSLYQRCDHYTAGVEYLPDNALRFTAEAFYKNYANAPVSVRNGISLANLGTDFNVLGNEAITTNGEGRAYGFEFFAQKKLADKFFGILSYTFYRSEYAGTSNKLVPSSWDNKNLISATLGYKFQRNIEVGLKFRYQGAAPYTPYDETASQANYLSLGQGVFDYSKLNTERLAAYNSADIRIDKKWNFKKTTLDVFIDITNFYIAKSPAVPSYTFKRTADNSAFLTTDGMPVKADGSNAVPTLLKDDSPFVKPTLGFIFEF
jgi:outer membrane receptor for ferrienterochelin and colicin